jgi:hypothetical protein
MRDRPAQQGGTGRDGTGRGEVLRELREEEGDVFEHSEVLSARNWLQRQSGDRIAIQTCHAA